MEKTGHHIGIMGAGAMGSLFSYLFGRAGVKLSVYEQDRGTVLAMNSGLLVRLDSGDITVPVEISDDPSILSHCTHLMVSVKGYSTKSAITTAAGCIPASCIVISLQNGLGNAEIILEHVPPERFVYGTTTLGSTKLAPEEVTPGGMGETVVGGKNREAALSAVALLEKTGVPVRLTDDPDRALWDKAIINAAINPIGALLSIPNGEIIQSPLLRSIQESVVTESVKIASSNGIDFDPERQIARVRETCERTGKNFCSMLQDIIHRRKTEIDSINGAIIRFGARHGIPAPVNESLHGLVRLKEELPHLRKTFDIISAR